jgi:hypothetical protein
MLNNKHVKQLALGRCEDLRTDKEHRCKTLVRPDPFRKSGEIYGFLDPSTESGIFRLTRRRELPDYDLYIIKKFIFFNPSKINQILLLSVLIRFIK